MADALSDYLEVALLNAVLRNTSYTSPATVYVGLFTSSVNDDASGTEVTGGSYQRTSVAFSAPNATTGVILNSGTVTFPTATGSWGTITYMGIFDAQTNGNLLFWGSLTTPKTVGTGDVVKFLASDLSITLT